MPQHKQVLENSVNHFGPRTPETDNAAYAHPDLVKRVVQPLVTVAGTAGLIVQADPNDTVTVIPANSLLKRAWIYTEDAFIAGTAVGITAGISGGTGDEIILIAGTGAQANLTALSWNEGDGIGLGFEVGPADVTITASWNAADATAVGTGVLVVEYIPPLTAYLGDKT